MQLWQYYSISDGNIVMMVNSSCDTVINTGRHKPAFIHNRVTYHLNHYPTYYLVVIGVLIYYDTDSTKMIVAQDHHHICEEYRLS